MPTYEYRCKRCGEHLEVVQSFTDDTLTDCPSCGAVGKLRKVFGNIGITFKGSGFYKTDSRSASSSTSKSDSSTETKTETKADTKSDGGDKKSDTSEKKSESKPDKKSGSSSSTSAA